MRRFILATKNKNFKAKDWPCSKCYKALILVTYNHSEKYTVLAWWHFLSLYNNTYNNGLFLISYNIFLSTITGYFLSLTTSFSTASLFNLIISFVLTCSFVLACDDKSIVSSMCDKTETNFRGKFSRRTFSREVFFVPFFPRCFLTYNEWKSQHFF